jgi:hypothetical protein
MPFYVIVGAWLGSPSWKILLVVAFPQGPGLVAKTLADFLNSSPVRAKLFAATAVARPYEEAEFDAGVAAIRLMPLPIPTVSDWEDDPDVPVAFENVSLRTAIGKVIRQELRAGLRCLQVTHTVERLLGAAVCCGEPHVSLPWRLPPPDRETRETALRASLGKTA